MTTDEKQIAFGGALKSTPIDAHTARVGGYLIYFTDETEKDLYGEYFNAKTDFCVRSIEEMNGLPVYYQHGLDDTLEVKQLSRLENVHMDDVGIWADAQLDLHDDYQRAINEKLVAKNALAWSSGAWPQSYRSAPDGWVERWRVIEGSWTPTPAMPKRTVISAKAYTELLKDGTGHERQDVGRKADLQTDSSSSTSTDTTKPSQEGGNNMTVEEMFAAIIDLLKKDAAMDQQEQGAVTTAMQSGMTPEELAAAQTPDETPAKSAALDKLMMVAAKARHDFKTARQSALAARWETVKGTMGNAPATQIDGKRLGAASPDTPVRIEGMTNLKYAGMTDLDMAMGYKLAVASTPLGVKGMEGKKPTDFVSKEYFTEAVHKSYHGFDKKPLSRSQEHLEIKSAMPWRANELDASDISGQGAEWLAVYYDAMVWEKARDILIYKTLLARGMQEAPVPQGYDTAKVYVEGNDPVVYGGSQANSVGSDGRPEMVYKITPFGTLEVDVTPGIFRAAVAYTRILGEGTLVNVAKQANYQLGLAMEENMERVILNGDTATGNGVNINFINGTPTSAGLTKDAYLEFDGILKSPLVTSTAYSLDAGGALSIETYLNLLAKFPSAQASRFDRLVVVSDFRTFLATLKLPDLKTRDVAGEQATVFTGKLSDIWGIPRLTSGFMDLANNAGKVPRTAGVSTGTLGRITMIDPFYWAFTWKRQIGIETERNPSSESDVVYAAMRFTITRRSPSAAAAAYNVLV